MYDAGSPSEALQRARGVARVGFVPRDGATVLADLRQEGCLKVRFPYPEAGAWTGAVLLNTSGGVASGDVLRTEIAVAAGACATIATQAAERIYRAPPAGGPAVVRTRLAVAAGAALEWLPQETILFQRARLDRQLVVELQADSWFLGVETLIFGRAEMGEELRDATLRDLFRVTRDGRPVLHDAIRLEGDVAAILARPAVARGGRAVATIVHAGPDAAARCAALREALDAAPAESGASAWDGLLVARIVARDGACARAAVLAGLAALRDRRPVPRVWLC
jgi:urease accessory protein